jgi:hypothetical protein
MLKREHWYWTTRDLLITCFGGFVGAIFGIVGTGGKK